MQELANKLAMHVVGALPKFLDASSVPEETLEAERQLLREQAARTGKPEAIIEKMVEGRLKKFYEEVCLLEQPYIMDDKQKVNSSIVLYVVYINVYGIDTCLFCIFKQKN